MPTLTMEVTIRLTVDKDFWRGCTDEQICNVMTDPDMIITNEWDAVYVRVAQPECQCSRHQMARQAYAECGGGKSDGNQA